MSIDPGVIFSFLSFIAVIYVGVIQRNEMRSVKEINSQMKLLNELFDVGKLKEYSDMKEELVKMRYDKISGDTLKLAKQFDMTLEKYSEAMAFTHVVLSKFDKDARDAIIDIHLKLNKSDLATTLDKFAELDE